jgi:hypothetical protein
MGISEYKNREDRTTKAQGLLPRIKEPQLSVAVAPQCSLPSSQLSTVLGNTLLSFFKRRDPAV